MLVNNLELHSYHATAVDIIQRWIEPTIIRKTAVLSVLHAPKRALSIANQNRNILQNPKKNKLISSFRTKSRKECPSLLLAENSQEMLLKDQ